LLPVLLVDFLPDVPLLLLEACLAAVLLPVDAFGVVVYDGFLFLSVSAEFVGWLPFLLSPSITGFDGVEEVLEYVVSASLRELSVAGSNAFSPKFELTLPWLDIGLGVMSDGITIVALELSAALSLLASAFWFVFTITTDIIPMHTSDIPAANIPFFAFFDTLLFSMITPPDI
jgi:hypothetical protein